MERDPRNVVDGCVPRVVFFLSNARGQVSRLRIHGGVYETLLFAETTTTPTTSTSLTTQTTKAPASEQSEVTTESEVAAQKSESQSPSTLCFAFERRSL